MSLPDRFLSPDADMARLLAELVERLPESGAAGEPVESRFWDEALLDPARDIIGRSGKGIRATLVERGWQLAGATGPPPPLLPALVELLHVGSLVIDDIEDDSETRRGEPALHRRYGVPTALNTGNWLYFVALALLARIRLAPHLRLSMYEDVSTALLRCHQGQALDLSIDVTRVRQDDIPALVARSTGLKTGALMELAAVLGARAAGADTDIVASISRFAAGYGVGLQMLDDWSGLHVDARKGKGAEDIRLARLTWPWAWLARKLDEVNFAAVQHQARATTDEVGVAAVIERMHGELVMLAGGEIQSHLHAARDDLAHRFGPDSQGVRALERDIDGLERAYA